MPQLLPHNLTTDQQAAIENWWQENDPDGYTYENRDNHRYAIQGDAEQEADYEKRRSNGCCGYMDTELPLPDGTVLLYGFNYGH